MEELPKIVRSRLALQGSAGQAHPDANLLAAFAEQTLLEREHVSVSAHLAQCAECRETLALASVALEPAVVHVTTKRHWFLEWRWVGAAAAACCVIAVALQYRVPPPPVEKPKLLVVRNGSAAAAPPAQPPAAQQIAVAPKLKVESLNNTVQLPPAAHPAQEQSPPVVIAHLDASASERYPAPAAARPVEPPAPPEQAKSLPPSALEPKETSEAVGAQKDIAAFQAQGALQPQASAFARGLRAPVVTARKISRVSEPHVLWSINASPANAGKAHGVVERSLDSGQTWEAAPLTDDVSFRTVVSAGLNVWAGGTNGALFHSADGGAHWDRITVSDVSGRLTGAIVNIDAQDSNLLKITTSTGEKWISSDGGRQWKRQ